MRFLLGLFTGGTIGFFVAALFAGEKQKSKIEVLL